MCNEWNCHIMHFGEFWNQLGVYLCLLLFHIEENMGKPSQPGCWMLQKPCPLATGVSIYSMVCCLWSLWRVVWMETIWFDLWWSLMMFDDVWWCLLMLDVCLIHIFFPNMSGFISSLISEPWNFLMPRHNVSPATGRTSGEAWQKWKRHADLPWQK